MVKLKLEKVVTDNPAEGKYPEIVRTRFGGYRLLFPKQLTQELKLYVGKDFDMDIVKDGEALRVILTYYKHAKPKSRVVSSLLRKLNNLRIIFQRV